jgi:Family of unknown function (DUF6232)
MITYYRDDSVEITSRAIQVDNRLYRLGELATVHHRDGGRGPGAGRILGSRIALALVPPLLVVAALALALVTILMDAGPVTKLLLFMVAGMLALAVVPLLDLTLGGIERTYDRGTRVHEIWAYWRGTEVMLVRTADRTRFGRIYRALRRAIEQH